MSQEECLCNPCESPAYGAPGYPHCAACCYGSLIADYNHDCPIKKHQEMAEKQYPIATMIFDWNSL